MDLYARVYVAGGQTLIGTALLRQLRRQGWVNLIAEPEPDLTDAAAVRDYFDRNRPEYVFMAAGKSGGIEANRKFPATLMIDNLLVESNVIQTAHLTGVRKLLYLASSCCYPRQCPQPMPVEALLTGPLEPTNEAYAVAKIAGLKLCEAYRQQYAAPFIAGIPANAFGPGDDFGPEESHVIAALIRRMEAARQAAAPAMVVWGTGRPRREFIFADDLADACIFVMQHYDAGRPINLGGGADLSIGELAGLVRDIVGYTGALEFDDSRPDGMPLKALDSGPLLRLGWRAATPFREALALTYANFLSGVAEQL